MAVRDSPSSGRAGGGRVGGGVIGRVGGEGDEALDVSSVLVRLVSSGTTEGWLAEVGNSRSGLR